MIKASTLPVFRSYINQVDKPEWVYLNDNIMESGLTWGPLISLKKQSDYVLLQGKYIQTS